MTLVCLLSYSENCGKPSHTFQTNCRVTTHIHLLVQVFWAMEGGVSHCSASGCWLGWHFWKSGSALKLAFTAEMRGNWVMSTPKRSAL